MFILTNALKNLSRNKGRNILMGIIILAIMATSSVALIISNTSASVIDDYKQRFGTEVTIAADVESLMAANSDDTASEGGGFARRNFDIPSVSPSQALSFADSDLLKQSIIYASISAGSDSILSVNEASNSAAAEESKSQALAQAQEESDSQSAAQDEEQQKALEDFMKEFSGSMAAGGMGAPGMGGGEGGPGIFEFTRTERAFEFLDAGSRAMMPDGTFIDTSDSNYVAPKFNLNGGDFTAFEEGTKSLVDGSLPESIGQAVISTALAEENSLTVGSVIPISANLTSPDDSSESSQLLRRELSLTVVGIYEDYSDSENSSVFTVSETSEPNNEILTTMATVTGLAQSDSESGITIDATYYLYSPDDLDAFRAEVQAKGLDENLKVSTDQASYEAIVKPVENMQSITLTFLIVVLILGGLILALLSTLAIRERKYEIGVLRAMGLKKGKVGAGLMSENVILTLACSAVGIAAGLFISQPVASWLLDSQTADTASEVSQTSMADQAGAMIGGPMGETVRSFGNLAFGQSNLAQVESISDIAVSIGGATILQMFAIAIALAIVASIAGILKTANYEPIKILSNRD